MPSKSKHQQPKEPEEPEEPAVPEEPPDPPEEVIAELSTGLRLLLRPKDVAQVWGLEDDLVQQEQKLTELLGLAEAYPIASQKKIVCDFHIFNLAHARAVCLDRLQAATFHAIMTSILTMMKSENSVAANTKPHELCGVADCFKEFERLLLAHSINDPPGRLEVFRSADAKMLTDFAASTLFKHFLLYQFCLNFKQEVQTLRFGVGVDRPLPPPDLMGGRLKPGTVVHSALGGKPADAGEPLVDEEPQETEEEEIERIVQEKLREAETRLQARFDEREEVLKQRLSEKPKAKAKGKK